MMGLLRAPSEAVLHMTAERPDQRVSITAAASGMLIGPTVEELDIPPLSRARAQNFEKNGRKTF